MRLIHQFTIWYLLITTIVLIAGGILVFYSVQKEIELEESRRLKDSIALIAERLEKNIPIDWLGGDQITIEERNMEAPCVALHIKDTKVWFPPHQHYERGLKASASYKIKGKHYYITTYTLAAEPDEIERGVWQSLRWMFVLLLVLVGIASQLISRRVLAPFNDTLQAIRSFQLKQTDPVRLSKTRTKEFKTLNLFLEKMTAKAQEDFRSLKEFTENASHELQTPLAITRGKLELLMESDISDAQARLILAAHNAVEKLSKINQSLTLLTKLENQEYQVHQPVNLSNLIHNALDAFEELLEMKSIRLEKDIEENVQVQLNPVLADILFNNLFSNAIRHNQEGGSIWIELTSSMLIIKNTGNAPEIDTQQLFGRFKKSNQSNDSIGLGLAIVKQICDLNHFTVAYQYIDHLHTLKVKFRM